MTLNDFRIQAIHALENIADNPRFEAEQLIQWALKMNRNEMLLKRREALTPGKISQLTEALNRRLARERCSTYAANGIFTGFVCFAAKAA